ncbi:MAG TPA: ferritin family protein [Terriglobia bacterium]|nr:ferritin family protein [Terriglobia bacterium]
MNNYFRSMLRKGAFLIAAGLVSLTLVSPAAAASQPKPAKTVEDLRTACRIESNARARYLAFAQKADAEGYGEVASLFRAVARSEEVEVNNQTAVIKKLGAIDYPAAITNPVVKSTRENLIASAAPGEEYAGDMYSRFIKAAKAGSNQDAATAFFYAEESWAQNEVLFHKALLGLDNMKGKSRTYYVCTVCGYTAERPVPKTCETCASRAEKYEAVK